MKFKPNLRILENANSLSELIISIARDSSAVGERLSDGGTNPPLGVAHLQRWERWSLTLRKVSYK